MKTKAQQEYFYHHYTKTLQVLSQASTTVDRSNASVMYDIRECREALEFARESHEEEKHGEVESWMLLVVSYLNSINAALTWMRRV